MIGNPFYESVRPAHDPTDHGTRRVQLTRRLFDLERRIAEHRGAASILEAQHGIVKQQLFAASPRTSQDPPRRLSGKS